MSSTRRSRRLIADRPVGARIAAVIVVASLVAVVVGVAGLLALRTSAAMTDQVATHEARGVYLAQEMRYQLMTIRWAGTNRTLNMADPALKAKWTDTQSKALADYQAAGARYLSETDPSAAQRATVQSSLEGIDRFFALVAELDVILASGDMKTWNEFRDTKVSR